MGFARDGESESRLPQLLFHRQRVVRASLLFNCRSSCLSFVLHSFTSFCAPVRPPATSLRPQDLDIENNQRGLLATTQARKQLRYESLPVFYALNTFFLSTKPDLNNLPWTVKRKINFNRHTFGVVRQWLRSVGQAARSSIKTLTFDMDFWSTAPVEVDEQGKWYGAAQAGALRLRDCRLPSTRVLRVHVAVPHYAASLFWRCEVDGHPTYVHQDFDLVLPAENRSAAIASLEEAVFAQRDKSLKHRFYWTCRTHEDESVDDVLDDLLATYYMLFGALGVGWDVFCQKAKEFCGTRMVWPHEAVGCCGRLR